MKIQESLDIAHNFDESNLDAATIGSSRFKRLGEEFFGHISEDDIDLDKFFKQLSKYNLYALPLDLNEFFLNYHYPQFSFLKEYYLINELTKKSNERRNLTFSSKQMEEFFVKWATAKNDEGKLYYAKSILAKVKDDQSKIINIIILAFIFTYENSLLSLETASNLLDRAENIFDKNKNKTPIRDRVLYLINIFSGFTHLKNSAHEEAYLKFQNALSYNKWSANAKFYSALTEIELEKENEAIQSIEDVIKYDEMRINFAITSNNYKLFKYFINNSFVENVFKFNEFSALYNYFNKLASEKFTAGSMSLEEIISKSEGLNEKKVHSYLHDTNRKDLVFIGKLLKDYKESQHYYVQSSLLMIEKKLNNIIESIIKNIKEHYQNKLLQHEKLYDDKLASEAAKIADLENSIREAHKKLETDFKRRKSSIEREIDRNVRNLEFKLESLENSQNAASMKSFTNSMFYNVFISIFVALTGGFAEYTNSQAADVSSFGNIFSVIILHGIKWGLLSFIIGLVASGFTSVSTVISIYSKKQKLSKKINDTNSYKDRVIQLLNNELEEAKDRITNNTSILIGNHKKNIERLKLEREKKIADIKEEIITSIENETAPFNELLL